MTDITTVGTADDVDATVQDLLKLYERRAATYAFISRLYRKEVDPDLLAQIKTMRFPASTGNDAIDKGQRLIAGYASNTWSGSLNELAVDYVRTFIGHGVDGFSAAYPYESVYTSEKRLLMQEARDEVLAIYRSQNLGKSDDWKDIEDHLALELEFMQIMIGRAMEALQAGDEDRAVELTEIQAAFMADHLLAWVPMMTADMKKFSTTNFYQGLAWLTEGFLAEDQTFLDGAIAEEDD